jgi:hypothetical protein
MRCPEVKPHSADDFVQLAEIAISKQDASAARVAYLAAGRRAANEADWAAMIAAGDGLERVGAYGEAWDLLADASVLRNPPRVTEWRGEDLHGEALLVERRIRHTGANLRMGRFLGSMARFGPVIASVEPRLVPLFRRSFPEITVVAASASAAVGATRSASYERLASIFGRDQHAIAAGFRPLMPRSDKVQMFKDQRGSVVPPTLGIAWHSTNMRKQLPTVHEWAKLLRKSGSHIVSLQYREQEAGIDELARAMNWPLERSGELDQMIDLDGFAAQVASVDAVITISNTTAHMAGALGVPCAVVLDDGAHLTWPMARATTPFYPRTRLIRQHGRGWDMVLNEALASVEEMLGTG